MIKWLRGSCPRWFALLAVLGLLCVIEGQDIVLRKISEYKIAKELARLRPLSEFEDENRVRAIQLYRDAVQAKVGEKLLRDIAIELEQKGVPAYALEAWRVLWTRTPANSEYLARLAEMRWFFGGQGQAFAELQAAMVLDANNIHYRELYAHYSHKLPWGNSVDAAKYALFLAEKDPSVDIRAMRRRLDYILRNKNGASPPKTPSDPRNDRKNP